MFLMSKTVLKFQYVIVFNYKMHLTQLVSNFWGAVHKGMVSGFTVWIYPTKYVLSDSREPEYEKGHVKAQPSW